MSTPAERRARVGHAVLAGVSAVLLVLYLIPSRFMVRWIYFYNQNYAQKTGMKLSMTGVSSIGHVVLFAAMTIVTLRFTRMRPLVTVCVLGFAAGLIELAQRWIPTRMCSLKDLGFNFAGIMVGAGVSMILSGLRNEESCDTIAVQGATEEKEMPR